MNDSNFCIMLGQVMLCYVILCYIMLYIFTCMLKRMRVKTKTKVSLGEFWGETQGGPGLQIDNRYSKAKYRVKQTKTKTKTKYKAKAKYTKTKAKYRHRYTKKTSVIQTKTKTCSVTSSAKRTNLSGGLACLLWNPRRVEGYEGTKG